MINTAPPISPAERRLMLFALGITEDKGEPYRNRYWCGRKSRDGTIWRALRARGLAFEGDGSTNAKGQQTTMFVVSAAGMDALGVEPVRRGKLEGYEQGAST